VLDEIADFRFLIVLVEDDEGLAASYKPLNENGDDSEDDDVEASAFDDEADAEIIRQEKRKLLKAKGIKLNKPKAETDRKKAEKAKQDEEDDE
jgi:hypothetical protein